jgi:transposase
MTEFMAGIDIAQAHVDVALPGRRVRRFVYDDLGLDSLIAYLKDHYITHVVMEATGGLQYQAAITLEEAGLLVAVINAWHVRSFARAAGQLAKNDRLDAEMILRYGQAMRPNFRSQRQDKRLRELVTRRRQYVGMLARERLHVLRIKDAWIRKDSGTLIAVFERRIRQIEQLLKAHIACSEAYRNRHALMTSVPGIGDNTAFVLQAEMPELGTLSPEQAASLAGLAPVCRESGTMQGKRFIYGGRKPVRDALYMAAVVASRWNPPLRAHYNKLRANGKATKVALTAIMRKLIILLNAILMKQTPWQFSS